ncbi:MAG TPA: (Fe-S)-binding protein, partial [Burkholderiales bacterium]|nr:(Fe-S)-binding protein [Burkholderiales bacterium]
GEVIGEVGLFLGCIARLTDTHALNASIHVLNSLGYTVHVPQNQTCCGALHARYGEDAEPLLTKNHEAFSGMDSIVSTSSACVAELSREFQGRVHDISLFLDIAKGWERVDIAPFEGKIAVHDPCSLRNVLKDEAAPYRLLERIPEAIVEPLSGNGQCCGSAGSYFLTEPEMANALLDDKMEMIGNSGAQLIATSNVGCAMSLRGRGASVLHPVVILARQMGYQCSI